MLRGSDLAAVRDQLGREPTVPFTVAASCAAGHPLVIRNATRAADGTPFPTTFWLTCPEAVRAVSRLESGGAIASLDARIADDPALTAALEATHAEAAAVREAEEPGAGSWGGVGGTRRGLKCLHAHYANHLAGGEDRVGGWVAERVEPIHPEVRPSRIVAAIDQGTNSTRTLVLAEVEGRRVELARDLVITRLGREVDATGRIDPAALDRVAVVIGRYVRRARALGATSIVTGATSAVRDAANRQAFVDLVREATGVAPEIIDGEREAALSFAGAVDGLDPAGGPYAVCDIGGGSTEFVVGDDRAAAAAAVSLQLGSVRMTERHLHDDPPTTAQLDALRAEVDALLADVEAAVDGARDLIAVAGTAVTVQAVALGLDRDDPDRIHGSRLDVATAGEVAARLSAMTVAERDALGPMPRGRGEVIAAGAQILHRVLLRFGRADARISETDILDALGAEALAAEAPG